MNKIFKNILVIVLLLSIIFVGISIINSGEKNGERDTSKIPNPASVYCEENNGTLEIRTSSDGSQSGYCIFYDGSECEEWIYYRGECIR